MIDMPRHTKEASAVFIENTALVVVGLFAIDHLIEKLII